MATSAHLREAHRHSSTPNLSLLEQIYAGATPGPRLALFTQLGQESSLRRVWCFRDQCVPEENGNMSGGRHPDIPTPSFRRAPENTTSLGLPTQLHAHKLTTFFAMAQFTDFLKNFLKE